MKKDNGVLKSDLSKLAGGKDAIFDILYEEYKILTTNRKNIRKLIQATTDEKEREFLIQQQKKYDERIKEITPYMTEHAKK